MYTFDWLARRAVITPAKRALVDAATDRRYTYREFDARVNRLANFMQRAWNIARGDRVAVLALNSSDYFEIYFAVNRLGAILLPLNWRLAAPELEFILGDAAPRALIYEAEFGKTVDALRATQPIENLLVLRDEYEYALAEALPDTVVMPRLPLTETQAILYTAGTTGRPKGARITFAMTLYNAVNMGLAIGLTNRDVTLNVLPTFHTGGLNLYAMPTFHAGGVAIIQRTFDAAECLRLIARERVTAFFGVPAHYLFLNQSPELATADLSSVRVWMQGGAPMPVSLLEQLAQRGIVVRQGFGMTETSPTVFTLDQENALRKAGSVGRPVLHAEVRIVDGEGRDVPTGEIGELWVRGPLVTPGYWNRPDATAQSFSDDWFHIGDAARCDDEGFYYIVDRWKDMFISGGENVYPAEVEQVLFSHPAVAEAAVIGVPDEKWGEVGKAIVVLKKDATAAQADLLAFCQGKLARYKIPKSVAFIDSLPRNAAGKVLKRELRERFK
ncbi:MAG: long-chain fatty acid--CoA ligase [Chloroflexi bacterium]|nr:long-chain fatty acid--CoA ligase [Chloroflexota bacterium]